MWSITNVGKSILGSRAGRGAGVQNGNGKIIALWGAPGAGKTTLAVKLAKLLADKKKDVALVLCDRTAPMLPCLCGEDELLNPRSLGSLLVARHPRESFIRYNAIQHKALKNLLIFSYLEGESEGSYPPQTAEQCTELIHALSGIASYVIVDCSSHIAGDLLSRTALTEADCVLRLSGTDLKSRSYFASQNLAELDAYKQFLIASNTSTDNIPDWFGRVSHTLPTTMELATQLASGNLLSELTHKNSRAFTRELQGLCWEVCGI